MERQIKRIAVLVIGWLLIAFGVVGLFLPILQGVLFILLGLLVLSRESETAHRWLQRGRQRYPHLDSKLKEWREWWRQRFSRQSSNDTQKND
ncbi:MAG: DUF454 family protein [Acidobacteriota bacterium]|jgi:uncharacterized membrane protein YbaN (DUF454 family)|nr:DUF454 family protein [Acidobacteriota bacterium]